MRRAWQACLLSAATVAVAMAIAGSGCAARSSAPDPAECTAAGRQPTIRPDYAGTVIPSNIAPLNFVVEEPGTSYIVRISCERGEAIELGSADGAIEIPLKPWRELLKSHRGAELSLEIFVKGEDGRWTRFEPLINRIAPEPIDSHLVYRLFRSVYTRHGEMAICQRNLENYEELVLLDNNQLGRGCVNCHTFLNNNPDDMVLHTRTPYGLSMLLSRDGRIDNVDSRTMFGKAPMGFTTWHPSGRLIVFSVYQVRQFFHSIRTEVREAIELDSALGYYQMDSSTISSAPPLSRYEHLELQPEWSRDGRYLYFCDVPRPWAPSKGIPREYDQAKYSLVRVSYDPASGTWGQPETVLSVDQTGLSITEPRFSPDGRFLLFCMSARSMFPAFQPDSDIYLMDMSTGQYKRLECNSDHSESWHSWSSNGRWIALSSKRGDGLLARVYFSYIDEQGVASKPFLLPQKDPRFYDSFIKIYQLPELIKGPVRWSSRELSWLIRSGQKVQPKLAYDGVTAATPAQPQPKAEPWEPAPRPGLLPR